MKDLAEKIEVMQAALDGKEIEVKYECSDKEYRKPHELGILWNWQIADYRIKPEPREFWVNIYKERDGEETYYLHTTEYSAKSREDATKKTIRVVEVIE